jgi:CubicO group peptidase (beta-lactamase class C family)
VLLIARDGKTLHEKAYGFASLVGFDGRVLESPEPMMTDHVFDLASLTKVFATTFGVMLLVDRGEITLDSSVSTYVPDFTGPRKDSVTVRDLLSHRGGLAPWKPVYYHAGDAAAARRFVTSEPLAYPVGSGRHYSDLGFMSLGYIVEEVSGRRLNDYLVEELYRPLGLESTTFLPREQGLGPFAATSHGNPFERRMVSDDNFGYVCDEDPESFTGWRQYTLSGEVNDGNAYHAHGGVAGHAGLFSTARELKVLLDVLHSGGLHGGTRVIAAEVVDEFLTPGAFGNGLGWAMSPRVLGIEGLPAGSFGHTGFTGTYALAMPEDRVSVILLTNRQNLGVGADTRYNDVNPLRSAVVSHIVAGLRESGSE